MRFYTNQHPFYCGIDLHARSMYGCILSQDGEILVHRNMKAAPEPFLKAVAPYRDGLVVAVECIFTWYSKNKSVPISALMVDGPTGRRAVVVEMSVNLPTIILG